MLAPIPAPTPSPPAPTPQVAVLMRLLADFVATDCEELCANGVRLLVSNVLCSAGAATQQRSASFSRVGMGAHT